MKKQTQPYEIEKHLVLSPAHITEYDAALLVKMYWDGQSAPMQVSDNSSGWHIRIPGDPRNKMAITDIRNNNSFSPQFIKLLFLCVSLNCEWLYLDSDGPIMSHLPKP